MVLGRQFCRTIHRCVWDPIQGTLSHPLHNFFTSICILTYHLMLLCRVVSCQGVGPHGFSVWGHASHKCINGTGCTAIDKKGECHEKGGPHWMVQETAWYGQDSKLGKQWYIRISHSNGFSYSRSQICIIYCITGIHLRACISYEEKCSHTTW